jgi:hypothetical protein
MLTIVNTNIFISMTICYIVVETSSQLLLPFQDTQEIRISYPSIFELMEDLKGMGENNASWSRKSHISRDTLFGAGAVYKGTYGSIKTFDDLTYY